MVFRSRRTTPPNAQGRWSLLPVREHKGTEGRISASTTQGAPGLAPETWQSKKPSQPD